MSIMGFVGKSMLVSLGAAAEAAALAKKGLNKVASSDHIQVAALHIEELKTLGTLAQVAFEEKANPEKVELLRNEIKKGFAQKRADISPKHAEKQALKEGLRTLLNS